MKIRPRRLRKNSKIRSAIQETHLSVSQLVYPIFVSETIGEKTAIDSLPGQFRWGIDRVSEIVADAAEAGVFGVAVFPAIAESKKDPLAKAALEVGGLVGQAIEKIKQVDKELQVITDIALDPFNSDGQDGIVVDGEVDNDRTVEVLRQMALIHAQAGADWVAPSDMMDGRIGAIRQTLDTGGFSNTGIISYCAKYASAFYGPFRQALNSEPKGGDKKSYQMNPCNRSEALLEMQLDVEEGADILMVKPALAYLDVILELAKKSPVPIAAYQVSGEYAMIESAARNGWLDREKIMYETLISIRRAGASMIFSYHALDYAKLLKSGNY